MAVLIALLPLAVESAAQEGKKILSAMLIVGAIFIGVIALGQTMRWLSHRRAQRRSGRQPQY